MSTCRHGQTDSHGEVGKDWCPGALSPFLEPWRAQLEFQMNDNTFASFTIGEEKPGVTIHPITTDALSDFRPLGYFIDGRWCMFEKPGEYVSLPVLPE